MGFTMPFPCSPVDATFFDSAPMRFVHVGEIPACAADVFALLKDPDSWPRWFDGIKRVQVTTPPPYGQGLERTVWLDALTVYEHFFRWEEGRRFSFYFKAHSVPLARRFAEDYLVEDIAPGRCRFTYTVALEPSLLFKLGGPIGRIMLDRMFRKAPPALARYVEKQARKAA